MPSIRTALLSVGLVLIIVAHQPAFAACSDDITHIPQGIVPNADSSHSVRISNDGQYVALSSPATNLIDDDTNAQDDIFAYNTETCFIERISVASDGTQANGKSLHTDISGDGRYIAFASEATNLVDGDANAATDIFVHDRQTATTTRVSVASNGTQSDALSELGRMSGDGRYITFSSAATNLVADDTNAVSDVFVHDRQTGATTRASVASDGTQGNGLSAYPSISDDGRYLVFESIATNFVENDTSERDIFVHDLQIGTTTRINNPLNGSLANGVSTKPLISGNGRFIAYETLATNLPESNDARCVVGLEDNGSDIPPSPIFGNCRDILRYDRDTGITTNVQPRHHNELLDISTNGRYVVFRSPTHYTDWSPYCYPITCPFAVYLQDHRYTSSMSYLLHYHYPFSDSLGSISDDGQNVVMSSKGTLFPNPVQSNYFLLKIGQLGAITNGDFSQPIGSADRNWGIFPDDTVFPHRINNGVFEFYGTAQGGVVLQRTEVWWGAGTPVEVQFDMGNTSANRKRVTVIVWDSNFDDLRACSFWLPPNTPLQPYRMQFHLSQDWGNAQISFYVSTFDSTGWYQIDNVVMRHDPRIPENVLRCYDPNAPIG